MGYREIRAKRIFPFQRLSAILAAPLHLGRDSSGALLGFEPLYARGSSRVPLRIPRDGGGTYLFPSTFSTTFGGFLFRTLFVFRLTTLKPVRLVFPSFLDGGHGRHHYQYQFVIDVPPSFVVQPQLRIGGSIGIQRDQSKAYLPLLT